MTATIARRVFLRDVGKGSVAIAVFGFLAACSSEGSGATTVPATTVPAAPPTTPPEPATTEASAATGPPTTQPAGSTLTRVNRGFVSAYILSRAGEAALVDTGDAGSASAISDALTTVGLGWDSVGHVILTHRHPDHVGSLDPVLTNAASAAAYAGEADIPRISTPRPLTAVSDGDQVFDLEIIATPGHTAGHLSVLDPISGVLVAGDAMNGVDGGVAGANPAFTDDLDQANESIKKLAQLTFQTVVFGHGEPVEGNASAAVAALAADL